MKRLVIFPRGQLSAKDKERMSKEGYLAVEADDPASVIQPSQALAVPPDKLLLAALRSMDLLNPKLSFVDKFTKLLEQSIEPKQP